MTRYVVRVFSPNKLIDSYITDAESFDEFVSQINDKTKCQHKTIGEWRRMFPLMLHAYPNGQYKGVDKIIRLEQI